MVRISVELIRKKSEHNEGEISTLEEISLHQENIEKIELIDKLCRKLKILLLQYNLISKIENLNKLKYLEYLNLALNNIVIIENLEGLECLKKLDLTMNFIGDLKSVKTLKLNYKLEQLYLTGNPCTDYDNYRNYVITVLPQIKQLDMIDIKKSDRIIASQKFHIAEGDVVRGYWDYMKLRKKQIERYENSDVKITEITDQDDDDEEDEDKVKSFWNEPSYNTPEDRIKIAKKLEQIENKKNHKKDNSNTKDIKNTIKLFTQDGRPYNINQPKVPFKLNDEDDRDNIFLEISLYKHMDTSHVDIDIQPKYIRVTIKGKILQLTLPCEIETEKSVAKRNTVTGNLLITMPRLNPLDIIMKKSIDYNDKKSSSSKNHSSDIKKIQSGKIITKRELLEIGPPIDDLDFSNIYKKNQNNIINKSSAFIDNPDVPPLE
ncbi:dynein axonemal assembly factor 11 [Aphidius gifuensis]|uniref:dynein axonemal assembly factor 11 n=1 Tax=Aphidius gifuensis TaxID=684658 RepID=UPI001CDCACF9|nr:dynein axonemal assembly factor 11 [Aphidius gifuensis]